MSGEEGAPRGERKDKLVPGGFDAFVFVVLAGPRGRQTAIPAMSLFCSASLTLKEKALKWCIKTACLGVGHMGDDTCLEGFSSAKRYAAEPNQNGL